MFKDLKKIKISILEVDKVALLGSKELGTNVLELYFVVLANHDQNVLVLFRLAQSICFSCKVGIEFLQDLLCKSAWLDQSRIRLDRSKSYLRYKRENPSHVFGMLFMLCV